jgi:hypothetical protein
VNATTTLADLQRINVLSEIGIERINQDSKWGEQNHPNGTGPQVQLLDALTSYNSLRAVAKAQTDLRASAGTVTFADILLEEVIEALAESNPQALRAELVQVAAVAAQWIEAIDRKAADK